MDTITQIALGAAVGEAVLGRRIGNRALIWGGLCGLLPDLDVLIPYGDAVKNFTYHRGFSHSALVLTALTPVFVWLILKVHPETYKARTQWAWLVFLAFMTHIVLDCLTVYGTQILWPLPTPPVMWSTIFIIDPAYSLPLIIGVVAAMVMSRKTSRGHAVNTVCLTLGTLYLAWSVGAKVYVDRTVRQSLAQQGITHTKFLTVPTPFNTLLWRVLVMDDQGYREGFYSLMDENRTISFTRHENKEGLLNSLAGHWPVQRLKWFTHGYYAVRLVDKAIVLTDLRMGLEPYYVFQFKVGEMGNPHPTPTDSVQIKSKRGVEKLKWIWVRIWGEG